MNVKFGQESVKRMVKGYYKKHYDFDCDLSIEKEIEQLPCIGRSFVLPKAIVKWSLVLNGMLDVNGKEEEVSVLVTDNKVKDAIKARLVEDNYSVESVEFDLDTNSEQPIFKGAIVNMNTNRKAKVKNNGNDN